MVYFHLKGDIANKYGRIIEKGSVPNTGRSVKIFMINFCIETF